MNFIDSVYRSHPTAFTTPVNCYYLNFASDRINDNVCINLSWDGSRDGEYEPYQKWSYPLDSSLELRGIPKLDANNNLYYDGDMYAPDGTVTRRIKEYTFNGEEGWSNYGGQVYYTTVFSTDAVFDGTPPIIEGLVSASSGGGSAHSNTYDTWLQGSPTYPRLYVCAPSTVTSTAEMQSFMSGKKMSYKLATPTTESAEPYTNPQIVDDFGTEEYVIDSTIDVPIPVGHNTDYPINLKSKLEMAPDSPDGDGDYIVRQTNGTNEYVPLIIEDQLPAVPSTDGTYTLTVTIANGEATYSWT